MRASEAFQREVAADGRQSAARRLDDGVPGAADSDVDERRGGIVEEPGCTQALDVSGSPVLE
jgi:hypothetical protein